MKIYIDFDDCLCETARAFTEIAKRLFGKDVPYEKVRFFNLQQSFELTDDELKYLEEPYVPHPLAGVMAQNKRTDASKKHVWTTGAQKILEGEK